MKISTLLKLCSLIIICLALPCALDASYTINTFAGTNSTSGFSGDTGIATSARLNSPAGVCFDTASTPNLYMADTGNHVIRMVCNTTGTYFGTSYTTGKIYTIAGTAGTPTIATGIIAPYPGSNLGDNGPATSATLFSPSGICVDGSGNLYIADTSNNVIRMVCNTTGTYFGTSYTTGYIYTIAGSRASNSPSGTKPSASYSGDGGIATSAKLRSPFGVCVDSFGNLYIADTSNNVIRMVYNSGTVFGSASGMIIGASTTLTQGCIYTIVGSNSNGTLATGANYSGDSGLATSATLNAPRGICFDSSGNLYIADSSNTVIRMVCNTAGTYFGSSRTQNYIYTVAGTYQTFAPFLTSLNAPSGVCVDSSGNLYIASTSNHSIKMVNTSGIMSTLAGTGTASTTAITAGDGGLASSALLKSPKGICVDTASIPYIYVADTSDHCIRKFLAPPAAIALSSSSLTTISSTISIPANNSVIFSGGGIGTISSNNSATLLGGVVLTGAGTTVELNHLTGSIVDALGVGASGNTLTMGTGTSIEVGIALTATPSIMPVPISYSGDIIINTADDTMATHWLETLAITSTASGANMITVKGGGTYTPAGTYTTGGTDVLAIVDAGTKLNLTNATYVPAAVKLGAGTILNLGCDLTSSTSIAID